MICCIIVLLFSAIFLFRQTSLRENTEPRVEIGNTIEFGVYEQDNNVSDGKEPLEWIVLRKDGDRVFLISKYCIDYKPYNIDSTKVTCR